MYEVVLAILLAAVFATVLVWPLGWRHHGTTDVIGAWFFGLLVFLPLLWLVVLWLPPTGPLVFGVSWVGPLAVGLLLLLLIAAIAPARRRGRRTDADDPAVNTSADTRGGDAAAAGFALIFLDVMLWLFLIGAIILLIVSYAT